MDPTAKSLELLSQSIPFVAVRIYDGYPELGTRLLVTHREVFGSVADPKLQSALVARAREVLARGRPASTELLYDSGALKVFLEPCLPDETLVIVGAGHIARPLCQLAKLLGFRVIIVDDREEYANREGFPQADEILVGGFLTSLRSLASNDRTYYVLVTRGHMHDTDCLRVILKGPAAYIGMIGSYRRVKGVFRLLEQEGLGEDVARRVHAPIGLPIGARTPEEIAVSIISEIVSVRHQGAGWSLSLKEVFRKK